MLLKFLKHTSVEWQEDGRGHSWYAPGDCTVATVRKRDSKGAWLLLHSDDDMLCIVPQDSFEVIEDVEIWKDLLPQICQICSDVRPESHFFCVRGKVMCIDCFNLLGYHLARPFFDSDTSRYEFDKSQGQWIRTG